MRKSAQQALQDALDAIVEELKGIKGELHGMRVALATREEDFEKRHGMAILELKRHDRQIIDLQSRKVGGVTR